MQVLLRRFVEVKEAQQQRSATVIDHHAQGTAPGETHVLADDTTAHQRRITGTCLRDRDVRTTILVAQRQMKQQIAPSLDAQCAQTSREDRKSTRLKSSQQCATRMPSSA